MGLDSKILQHVFDRDMMLIDFIEQHPALHCIVNESERFVYVNRAFSDALEYTKEELYSKKIFHFVHPDDIEATKKAFMKELSEPFYNRYVSKSGKNIDLEWSPYTYRYNRQMLACAIKT